MARKIEVCHAWVSQSKPSSEIVEWISTQANGFSWFLAHAEDGVIWGRIENCKLITQEVGGFQPAFRSTTLIQARLFGEKKELLVWRDYPDIWEARLITEEKQNGAEANFILTLDEKQILWGTKSIEYKEGFTLMKDGEQGLHHAVPINVEGDFDFKSRPLRLTVRHYINEDENGFCRIALSRLVNVELHHPGGETL